MRTRTRSGAQLDQLMNIVEKTILNHQNPITGLFENNFKDFPGNFILYGYMNEFVL